MAQLFSPRATLIARAAIVAVPALVAALFGFAYAYGRSDAFWNVGSPAEQPIPFRHDLHVGGLGLDCRYCHDSVERAASAGMPSAETCLACHNEILGGAGVLEPLRTAVAFGELVRWTSVHRLPAHAYFHHGIHVAKGVGCEDCHGRVDRMERTVKTETLSMGWCLDCHRDPSGRLRPRQDVFVMGWFPDPGRPRDDLMALHNVVADHLLDCSTCHR